MTLDQIKSAIENNKKVFWVANNYEVIKDRIGQYLIKCSNNDSCIGLTHRDEVTLNGKESEFYIGD